MYEPKPYPKYITTPGGFAGVVPDHLTHSAITGEEYGPDGELVAPAPDAPTGPPPIDPDPPTAPNAPAPDGNPEPPPIDPDPPADAVAPDKPARGRGKAKPPADAVTPAEAESDEDLSGMFTAKE